MVNDRKEENKGSASQAARDVYIEAYRVLGLTVVPVKPRSKHLIIPRKELRRLLTFPHSIIENRVDAEFRRYAANEPNVGILTGSPSGNLVVLDFENLDDYRKLADAIGPQGLLVRTKRGCHVWLRSREPMPTFSILLLRGWIDIKGQGGYVLAPPSIHPAGARYEFVFPLCLPEMIPLMDERLEGWLRKQAARTKNRARTKLATVYSWLKGYRRYDKDARPVKIWCMVVPAGARPVTGDRHSIESHKDGKSVWVTGPFEDGGEKRGGEKNPKIKIIHRPFGVLDTRRGIPHYEQAIVNGHLCFITVDEQGRISTAPEFAFEEDHRTLIIRPETNLPYDDYVVDLAWFDEPDKCFDEEKWLRLKALIQSYMDFLDQSHLIITVAGVVVSYLSHLFTAMPYFFYVGDTDSGKSQVLRTLLRRLCDRPLYGEGTPYADIYEFITNYGSVILEDEVQGLEKNPEKLKIYKGGNEVGAKIARIVMNKNTGERRQIFYDTYGFKVVGGEKQVKDKGFMDRCLIIPMVKGYPEKDEWDPTDAALVQELRGRLLALRILTLAGKIKIPHAKIENDWFEGRMKKWYKPLLTVALEADRPLIIEHGRQRAEDRRAERSASAEAKILVAYLKAAKTFGSAAVPVEAIYEHLMGEMVEVAPEFRPGKTSVGMSLTKLGFDSAVARVGKKTIRMRIAAPDTLVKLARKYDMNDTLEEYKLSPPPIGQDVTGVTVVTNLGKMSRVQAKEPETTPEGQKRLDKPDIVTTVTTVTTSLGGEGGLDDKGATALRILWTKKDGYADLGEAARAVMGIYPDPDEARLFVNHLVRDSLFGLDPDKRWRPMK